MMSRLTPFFACLLLLVPTVDAQRGRRGGNDELSRAISLWLSDFRAGKIKLNDIWGPRSSPYLEGLAHRNRSRGRRQPAYTRLDEARDLFRRVAQRGTRLDAERLVTVIELSFTRKSGKLWDTTGEYSLVRSAAVSALRSVRPSSEMRKVIAGKVESGFATPAAGRHAVRVANASSTDKIRKLSHSKPDLAATLVTIIGDWKEPQYRDLLEDCLAVDDADLAGAAATALARMGFGRSITAVAQALAGAKYAEDVDAFADAIKKLVGAKSPPPKDEDLKYTLDIVLRRITALKHWRARISLVPLLRAIRSRGNVEVLIDLLEEANKNAKRDKRSSGTYRAVINEALTDLTGFYAHADAPEKWRAWWDSVKDTFVIPQHKKKVNEVSKNGSVASSFFGIPVTGNHVVFVVDVSGSMAWPYHAITVPGGGTRSSPRGPPSGKFESKMDRARKEIKSALRGMSPDSKFNVVFFSKDVRKWRDKLVWATPKNKDSLYKFVDGIKADGGTMLYDAMQQAMKIKLRKKKSQPYATNVDEIFVLSDGLPTLGTITNTDRIHETVTKWNRGAQVRIHTIYIGTEEDERRTVQMGGVVAAGMPAAEFMKRLAEDNNGKFARPNSK